MADKKLLQALADEVNTKLELCEVRGKAELVGGALIVGLKDGTPNNVLRFLSELYETLPGISRLIISLGNDGWVQIGRVGSIRIEL